MTRVTPGPGYRLNAMWHHDGNGEELRLYVCNDDIDAVTDVIPLSKEARNNLRKILGPMED